MRLLKNMILALSMAVLLSACGQANISCVELQLAKPRYSKSIQFGAAAQWDETPLPAQTIINGGAAYRTYIDKRCGVKS